MTGWSDIIIAAMQIIDDINWRDQLAISPAQFFRAKSETVLFAMPLLKHPPEFLQYLENGMQAPSYGEYEWVSDEASTAAVTVVNTGMTGYELCSVSQRSADGMDYLPYPGVTYDAETGTVTFPIQSAAGIEYSIDFYTDGEFNDLTNTQMRLFALAVAVTWDDNFQRDWLSDTMKLRDASFDTVNENNYMRQTNERFIANKKSFNDELRDYEQYCAYANVVGYSKKPVLH